ncbi:hypothetical protein GCM10009853_023920 [Glycomyces scopariae]
MADPPQYPVYHYPPQYPPYPYQFAPYPQPPRRPGLTTAAVVLMWILVGLGLLNGVLWAVSLTANADLFVRFYPGLEGWTPLVLLLSSVQALGLAALRSLFAVRIMRRSASARRGALAVEGVSIGLQVVAQMVLFSAMAPLQEGGTFTYQFDCTGIILSILVLCFLGAARSARWCDR